MINEASGVAFHGGINDGVVIHFEHVAADAA